MVVGVRSSRGLMSADISHASASLSALQSRAASYHGEPASAVSAESLSHGSPRFPVTGNERTAHPRLVCIPDPVSACLDESDTSHESPSPSHDNLGTVQATLVGPTRGTKSHSRRQPPGHIPRPRNAFILYRSWFVRAGFLADIENDHREISRIVGRNWTNMSDEEKAPWRQRAEDEKMQHAKKYPNYKYSPNSRRDGVASLGSSAPVRASTSRARKPKAMTPALQPTNNATEICNDNEESEEAEYMTKPLSPPLAMRVPPLSRDPFATQGPCIPVREDTHLNEPYSDPSFCGLSGGISDNSLASDGPLPAKPADACHWSLASCSAPPSDPALASEPDTSFAFSQQDYYNEDLLHMWALRPGFDGGETLNGNTACDDLVTEYRILEASTSSGNLHNSTSPAADHRVTSEPELSPFGRIVLEGTPAGHPGSTLFGVPVWSGLFQLAPTSSTFRNAGSVSDYSSDLSSGRYLVSDDYSVSTSASSLFREDPYHDCGLFSEWCDPDSPVAGSEYSARTPASVSTSIPSPSLPLLYPIPTYPLKQLNVAHLSWGPNAEDLNAYQSAVGGIKSELDEHEHEIVLGLSDPREPRQI